MQNFSNVWGPSETATRLLQRAQEHNKGQALLLRAASFLYGPKQDYSSFISGTKAKGQNKLNFLLDDNTPNNIEQTSTFDFNAAMQSLDHDPDELDDHDHTINEL